MSAPPPSRARRLVRSPAPWLFLLLLALYCLTLSGDFMISDGEVMFQTTVALADRGTVALDCNPGLPQIVAGIDGQCFSKYGLGMPLLAAAPYKFGRALARTILPNADPMLLGHFFVSFLNLVLTAGTGVALYGLARELYRSRWLGLLLALVYGVATSAWPYSKVFFAEPLIAFLLTVAAYACVRLRAPGRAGLAWAALIGLALGYAVLTKIASVIVLPLFGAYLLWRLVWRPWLAEVPAPTAEPATPAALRAAPTSPAPSNFVRIAPRLAARQARGRASRRVDPDARHRFPVPLRAGGRAASTARLPVAAPAPAAPPAPAPLHLAGLVLVTRLLLPLAAVAAPLALCAALLLWHNAVRFGSPFDSGYSDEGFTTPLYVGLYGFLFSSGKSIFLFAPVTLLSVPALVAFWRRRPAETLLAAGLALATLLYYAPWWAWYGGWSWGPRFLVPVLPFLVLPLGALLLDRRWARWALAVLVVAGVGVQLLGALIDFNAYIIEIVADNPENEARYLFIPWLSPLVGHLRYLVKGHHLAVATFDMARLGFSGRFAVLFPALVIGTLLLSAAALAAIFQPRRPPWAGGRR